MHNLLLFGQSSYDSSSDLFGDASATDTATSVGFFVFGLVFMIALVVIMYVISSLLLARIFKKAGVESWKAWVPVYNNWTMLELGGQKGYWAVLAFIPFVSIISVVFIFMAMYNIGLNFGKQGAFVLLGIFLPLVWYIWLAVDDSTWKGPRAVAPQPMPTNTDPHTPPRPPMQ